MNELKVDLDIAKRALAKIDSNPVCPTCGQKIGSSDHKKHIAEQKVEIQRTIDRKAKQFNNTRSAWLDGMGRATQLGLKFEKITQKIADYDIYVKTAELLDSMPEKLPEFDGEKLDEDKENEQLMKYQRRMDFLESCESMLDQFKEAFDLTKDQLNVELNVDELNSAIDSLTEKILRNRMRIEEGEKVREEIDALKERLSKMLVTIRKEESYSLLEAAFSKEGVQTMIIRSICARLEEQVNKYARLVFPEHYTFKFELETQFNIWVSRGLKKPQVSDVRKLSGSEYSLFAVLLMLSLMTFVPASKRWNVVILDELTARMGPEMIEAFQKFVVLLSKAIPHVVVITPDPDETYEGAIPFTAVKKGVLSRIVPGTPKAILSKAR
jgi:DNA repair exonuclease SbcCD ATPase subunit